MDHLRFARALLLTMAVLGSGIVSAHQRSAESLDAPLAVDQIWNRLRALAQGGSGPGGPQAVAAPSSPTFGLGSSAASSAAPGLGDVVGALELRAPKPGSFVLHGTMPVPPGTYGSWSTTSPLAVIDSDGSEVLAQVEAVSYYPNDADGAEVVEILARVKTPSGVAEGTPVRYEVVWRPHAVPAMPAQATMAALATATDGLNAEVSGFLTNPNSLLIVAADAFGNYYFADPLRGQNMRFERFGRTATQVRSYTTMWSPNSAYPGNTALPHLFGVHSYLSTWEDEKFIGLDLRFNNGADGNDKTHSLDDPLGKVYFTWMLLLVPSNWAIQQDVEDPFWGTPSSLAGYNIFPLIDPNPSGKFHVMPSQGQFHRRLALAPLGGLSAARAYLDKSGQAFCVEGTDATTGDEYWSWWNQDTARYFPQSHTLPDLDYYGSVKLDNMLDADYYRVLGYLRDGTPETLGGQAPNGAYPCKHPNLGWAHPFGVPAPGMVGGDEIYVFDGVRVADAASNLGYRTFEMVHRMQTDRMPAALYNASGQPSVIDDWVVEDPVEDFVPFIYFNGAMIGGQDVFGYDQAPQHQIQYVESNGLAADYVPTLLSYYPIDYQHYIRFTRSPKVLAWLGNDALSKDDLLMAFEAFQLGYHEYPLFNGTAQQVGLLADIQEVVADPGRGFSYGRGEGWGLDAANAAYALSSDSDWRAKTRVWMKDVAGVVLFGQSDDTGIIQSIASNKQFGGQYRFRQSIEAAITENALRGMLEVAWRDFDTLYQTVVEDVMIESYYGMVSDMSWWPGEIAPWAHVALGPSVGDASTQWKNHAQQLSALPYNCAGPECLVGHSSYQDSYQIGCSLAYAYELTLDPLFLSKALSFTKNPLPGQTLLQKLEADGMENIWNRAALIALAQELAQP